MRGKDPARRGSVPSVSLPVPRHQFPEVAYLPCPRRPGTLPASAAFLSDIPSLLPPRVLFQVCFSFPSSLQAAPPLLLHPQRPHSTREEAMCLPSTKAQSGEHQSSASLGHRLHGASCFAKCFIGRQSEKHTDRIGG